MNGGYGINDLLKYLYVKMHGLCVCFFRCAFIAEKPDAKTVPLWKDPEVCKGSAHRK